VKRKKTKTKYRVRNWKEYNASLKQRGSLTLWVSDDVLQRWKNSEKSGKRGRDYDYSDDAILTVCLLQEVFHLAWRQTEGFVASLFELPGQDLAVPNYSTISRRRKTLDVSLPRAKKGEPLHMLVDSTGVKVFGEGEWKVRQHGYTRRRAWRKLHLGIDAVTGEIVAAVVTTNSCADGQILPDLLAQVDDEIKELTGDGASDKRNCYDALRARGATATIPPQRKAKIWQRGNCKARATQHGTKTCAASARQVARRGRKSATIMCAPAPKPGCFNAKPRSARRSRRAALTDKLCSCSCAA
jgi:hypothetical protein